MRDATGVAAALPAEARLFPGWRDARGPIALGDGLSLIVTGVGAQRAAAGATALLAQGARALVSFGFAAGLAPGITAGTLLFPRRVLALDGRDHAVDARLRERLIACAPLGAPHTDGAVCETAVALCDVAAKAALHRRLGAAAADMESAAVARVAGAARLPFAVLRAVVDPAERAVPRCALCALDGDGRIRAGALGAALLRRPWEIAALLRLRRDFGAARAALAGAAAALTRLPAPP